MTIRSAFDLGQWAAGVLPQQYLRELVACAAIRPDAPLEPGQIQPASMDTRLGDEVWRVRTSFLPRRGESVRTMLRENKLYHYQLNEDDGLVLEVGATYIIPLQEHLDLPADIRGVASPKSTTGRLDIFCRIFTETGQRFDDIPAGYQGTVYLEVTPLSFPVRIRRGDRLVQLRLRSGDTEVDFRTIHSGNLKQLIFDEAGQPLPTQLAGGVKLSVGLQPSYPGQVMAFRARANPPLVDLRGIEQHPWEHYWEALCTKDESLILYPNSFYILASAEKVCVPSLFSCEMIPFDSTFGEVRVHYAGFFDPGFGLMDGAPQGTKAVLEIRNHGVPFRVTHGQQICLMKYEWLSAQPETLYGDGIGSNYAQQEVKLAKQFTMPQKQELAA